jgi:asparagine synthase (glutamine-hydrolysing)
MCGIFGAIGWKDPTGLREAALTLSHRGPDGFGEWTSADGSCYLAHLRLAIIDLSDDARQPMANADDTLQLVFNGEIYNFVALRAELEAAGYKFRSRSDSEVILHGYAEWGDAVVERLRGIFAFALWDDRQRRLLLARDRLGVKPLVYSVQGDGIAFASDTRALTGLLPGERSVNPDAMFQFLRQSYVSGSHTIWKGINRLLSATTLVFDARKGTISTRRYWQHPSAERPRSAESAASELTQLLGDAVQEELVADVPVGVFLSGGIDSSLVTSFAAESAPNIDSFFVDFAGWEDSERADAQSVSAHLRTRHHVEETSVDEIRLGDPESARELFSAFDEPIGDPAIVPTWLLSRRIRQHVTVALSGDGGDELFGGYRWYQQVVPTARRRIAWRVERARRAVGLGREWPQGCADEQEYYHLLHSPSFSRSELERLFPASMRTAQPFQAGIGAVALTPTRKLETQRDWQELDLRTYLVGNNLTRVDRASMAHGLEVRVPMLDHRVVEFAFGLPPELVSAQGGGKPLLRKLAARRLPQESQKKAKRGFSFPLQRIVSDQDMLAALRDGALAREGLLDAQGFEAWAREDRLSNHRYKLWLLFVFEHWARCWLAPPRAAA